MKPSKSKPEHLNTKARHAPVGFSSQSILNTSLQENTLWQTQIVDSKWILWSDTCCLGSSVCGRGYLLLTKHRLPLAPGNRSLLRLRPLHCFFLCGSQTLAFELIKSLKCIQQATPLYQTEQGRHIHHVCYKWKK